MKRDLLEVNMESDGSSSDENGEDDDEEQVRFKQWLREWNLKHNITVQACRELLANLKLFHPNLPLDPRTLNETPRVTLIEKFSNGSYVHVGLIAGLEGRVGSFGLKTFGRKKNRLGC